MKNRNERKWYFNPVCDLSFRSSSAGDKDQTTLMLCTCRLLFRNLVTNSENGKIDLTAVK
jgi:hypothetical protein